MSKTTIIQDVVSSSIYLGVACATAGAASPIFNIVAAGIAINGFSAIKDKYRSVNDVLKNWESDDLNHDIQKALIEAIHRSYDQIRKEYIKMHQLKKRRAVNLFISLPIILALNQVGIV